MNQIAVIAHSAVICSLNFHKGKREGEVKVDVLHVEYPQGVSISERDRAVGKDLPTYLLQLLYFH
jgi:hypothetical protein